MLRRSVLWIQLLILLSAFQPQKITWVAIGDSITYLNEHLDETGNRVTKGFLSRVAEKLPDIQYINQGHNGWTAVRIAAEFDHLGIVPADVYTVFLGTNDWWGSKPLGTMEDYKNNMGNTTVFGSFKMILDKLKILNPRAKVVLITPMQRTDFVYILNPKNNAWGSYKAKAGQELEQFAEAVKSVGKQEGYPVIDLFHAKGMDCKVLMKFKRVKDPQTGKYRDLPFPDYTNLPFHPETDEYPYPVSAIGVTFDGLHPSDAGNAMIAEKIVRVFRQIGIR
ncbi:MAG: SGNH/GDSL hydrolase family protein [Bacteroidota bacterium]|nr:SGNH/GDSL hydrolase family protein [Bacteroidota bacterium]